MASSKPKPSWLNKDKNDNGLPDKQDKKTTAKGAKKKAKGGKKK